LSEHATVVTTPSITAIGASLVIERIVSHLRGCEHPCMLSLPSTHRRTSC